MYCVRLCGEINKLGNENRAVGCFRIFNCSFVAGLKPLLFFCSDVYTFFNCKVDAIVTILPDSFTTKIDKVPFLVTANFNEFVDFLLFSRQSSCLCVEQALKKPFRRT